MEKKHLSLTATQKQQLQKKAVMIFFTIAKQIQTPCYSKCTLNITIRTGTFQRGAMNN